MENQIVNTVRNRPWASVLTATGLGMLIGRNVSRPVALAGLAKMASRIFHDELQGAQSIALGVATHVAREMVLEAVPHLRGAMAATPAKG